jgi:hypothetical protein
MHSDSEIRLTVAIDAARRPITGWIEAAAGEQRPFVGMLELIALLEGAREGSASAPGGGIDG